MQYRTSTEELANQLTDAGTVSAAHDALNKMQRAHKRGTGCHISADEIRSLSLTAIGELWAQDDPRKQEGSK